MRRPLICLLSPIPAFESRILVPSLKPWTLPRTPLALQFFEHSPNADLLRLTPSTDLRRLTPSHSSACACTNRAIIHTGSWSSYNDSLKSAISANPESPTPLELGRLRHTPRFFHIAAYSRSPSCVDCHHLLVRFFGRSNSSQALNNLHPKPSKRTPRCPPRSTPTRSRWAAAYSHMFWMGADLAASFPWYPRNLRTYIRLSNIERSVIPGTLYLIW
jgi:hypothetical protein